MQGNNSRGAGRGGLLGVAGFPRGVNRKVALLFVINLLSVLLVGGVSIVFARSIYIAAEKIRQEQREVQIADRIHTAFHHFLSTLHRAVILSRPIPGSFRSVYREEFRQLLAHEHSYHRESPEQRVVDRLKQASSQLFALSERLGTAQANAGLTPRHGRLFDELDDLAADIQLLTHSLSIAHQARMDRLLEGNKSSMQWIFALYAFFFVLGTALIAVSGIYFERTIARPLRQLASVAAEVAGGKRPEKTPVMSRDEMGLLTHSLNVMIERMAENEGRLKKLAILEERERIAGELHDAPAQSLAFLGLKLNELETGLAKVRPGYMDTSVIEMRKLIQTAYDEVREAIFALRVEASEAGGFVPTLAAFIRDTARCEKSPSISGFRIR